MNKIIRFGLTAFALAFFFNAFAVTDAKAQNVINTILNKMEAHRQSLSSLQSNVTMVKYNAQLQESDKYEGTTMYLPVKGRDALVRIDWTSPQQETLSVVNKQYILYRPRLNQAMTGSVNESKQQTRPNSALAFMGMSREQLKANYSVQYLGEEKVASGAPTWRLKLTPKTSTSYQFAEIWVDGNGMPIQGKVVENNNDSTTVLLTNLQKNVSINAAKFKVNLPKGTPVVKS